MLFEQTAEIKRVDGTMYSCTSPVTKLGGGVGTALAGWLPMIFNLLITLILTRLNVEKMVDDLKKDK